MSNFITPVLIDNVFFDMRKGVFYSPIDFKISEGLNECFKIQTRPLTDFPTDTSGLRILTIEKPTYFMKYYHYCFAHAYMDFTIPLLSILHEVDAARLKNRDYMLFFAKDPLYGYEEDENVNRQIQRANDDYFLKTVDFEGGKFKGEYAHFHSVLSKHPVFFEETLCKEYDIVKFSTLVIHGNIENQRNIHNHNSNYPDRWKGEPVATDEQIRNWVEIAKSYFLDYFQLPLENPANQKKKMIVIARKANRSFLPITLNRIGFEYGDREDIEFLGTVYLEEMKLRDQIQLFREVDIIVSTHGSGLSHLIWCKPGTKVFEAWLVKDRRWPIFGRMCKVMGLDYASFYRDSIPFIADHMFEVFDDFFSLNEEGFEALREFIDCASAEPSP